MCMIGIWSSVQEDVMITAGLEGFIRQLDKHKGKDCDWLSVITTKGKADSMPLNARRAESQLPGTG